MSQEFLFNSSQGTIPKRPLILAVDDDEDDLLLITQALELFSFSFIAASNGLTAIQLAQTQKPDLILLDIVLRGLSGIEVLRQLKSNPQTLTIPVIAVTVLARQEDRDRILSAGADAYMSKPYMVDDLDSLIRRHLKLTEP